MSKALKRMFVTMLVYCGPTGVHDLWDEFKNDELPRLIRDELSVSIPQEDLNLASNLNGDQMAAYTSIIQAIELSQSAVFFVDGPGGTGKIYLYRAVLGAVRSRGVIALATTTSGIAATLLSGGRTTHSRFKIPLTPTPSSVCSISKQSQLADLVRRATVILWDEATMTNRYEFEALDRTLRDITNVEQPFGGKVIVFGGDFRKVLPVILKGTREDTVNACIARSQLWRDTQILSLRQNMRYITDQEYSDFILRVGNGSEPTIQTDMIRIPNSMIIPWENDTSVNILIAEIFPNLNSHAFDANYKVERALITPRTEDVDHLNKKVINIFIGEEKIYHSFDRVENDTQNLYQQEFLNSISLGGLPPRELRMKKGSRVMLLRNLDPRNGLCNGTRLICRSFGNNFIDAEILSGHFKGTRVFLHHIPLNQPENLSLPFDMTRRKFPIRLSFALTINKAQGQTIPHVGIYLPEHVFSHGQLYVALSRGTSKNTTKVLVKDGIIRGHDGWYTKNVVYKEVLLSAS